MVAPKEVRQYCYNMRIFPNELPIKSGKPKEDLYLVNTSREQLSRNGFDTLGLYRDTTRRNDIPKKRDLGNIEFVLVAVNI